MGKSKTYEEALAQMETAKEGLAAAKEALREFKSENQIRRNKPVEDKKLADQLEKLEAAVDKAREGFDAAKEEAKELKPRKTRTVKYEYPADCITAADKKKYRAKMRREKKSAEKAAEGGEEKKVAKKKVVKKAESGDED